MNTSGVVTFYTVGNFVEIEKMFCGSGTCDKVMIAGVSPAAFFVPASYISSVHIVRAACIRTVYE